MKLGLIITVTGAGEQEAFTCNEKHEWACYAADARSYIKQLTDFNGTGRTVCFVRFLGTLGYLVCVVKAINAGAGRDFDNTSAWMFIPADADISGKETEELIHTIEQAISGRLSIDYDTLEKAFSREYDKKNVIFTACYSLSSPSDRPVTGVFYGAGTGFTFTELLGTAIVQPEYKEYGAIFFINQESGIGLLNGKPLKIERLKELRTVTPPPAVNGFKAYLKEGGEILFDRSIEVLEQKEIAIFWHRPQYKEVKKAFRVTTDGPIAETAKIRDSEFIRLVPKGLIVVKDEKGKTLSDYAIKVNGREVLGEYIEVSEAAFKHDVTIEISKKGFHTLSKGVKLSEESKKVFNLKQKLNTYEFVVPCESEGHSLGDGLLTVETPYTIEGSPIKGYALDGSVVQKNRQNRLEAQVAWWPPVKYFLIGFCSCLAIILLYAGCKALENYNFKWGWPPIERVKQETNKTLADSSENDGSPTYDDGVTAEYSDEAAVAYLNKNKIWHKDSLEKFELLKGLFDDMNRFELRQFKAYYQVKIKGCDKLEQIVTRAEKALENGWNPDVAPHSPQYNKEGDKQINVQGYIDWLSKPQTPPVSVQEKKETIKKEDGKDVEKKKTSATKVEKQQQLKKDHGEI